MANENQPRCPFCGRYQELEPDGYFGKLNPSNDMSPVDVFCNENHYDKYQFMRDRGALSLVMQARDHS